MEGWLPQVGEFCPGVNLLVGPNGSGKTSFMNALKLLFGRAAENSQTSIGDADAYPNDPKLDRHNQGQPWSIACRFAFPGFRDDSPLTPHLNFPGFTGEMHFGESSSGRPLGRWVLRSEKELQPIHEEWKEAKNPAWYGIYNRGFAMGWPRRITALNQEAFRVPKSPKNVFNSPENKTHAHYKHNWKLIANDARTFLGINLPDTPAPPSKDGFQCPSCTQPVAKGRLGLELLDHNGKPIYQGSDGIAHFLFMVMEIRKHPWPTTFIIEEPDVYLHPNLQKRFTEYVRTLAKEEGHQFFITTHSPYLLDHAEVADAGSEMHIYRVEYESKDPVQRVNATKEKWDILRRLGHTPADVLQSNAVIWVEGPSDATYITTWLNAYILQEKAKEVRRFLDYAFATFGGATLKYTEAHFIDETEKDHQNAFVQLLTINPNAAIIMDSDHKHPAKLAWFNAVKKRIEDEFGLSQRPCWILQANTIEDYIPDDFKDNWKELEREDRNSKPKKAQQYSELTAGKPLRAIVKNYDEVFARIAILHKKILEWSGK